MKTIAITALLFATSMTAQETTCPMHAQHMAAGVDARHDTFGMSHIATTHSFRLFDDDLKRLSERVAYTYEELPAGGRIRITASDPQALAAAHAFLRFQVVEHRTGDSGKIEPSR